MKHSDSIKELATALAKAQGELEGAIKDSTNPHFKSRYADLASVVAALKATFPGHGLAYVQTVVTDAAAVGVETMLLHASGEWIRGEPFFVPVNKADAQGFGSALTYCRRYSLAAMCGVAPEDDDGNAATKAAPAAKLEDAPEPKPMRPRDFQAHCSAISEATSIEALQKAYTAAVVAARHLGDGEAERSFAAKKEDMKAWLASEVNGAAA
jgi:hypothetical protein